MATPERRASRRYCASLGVERQKVASPGEDAEAFHVAGEHERAIHAHENTDDDEGDERFHDGPTSYEFRQALRRSES